MAELQLPFPFYSTGFPDLIGDNNELVTFFQHLDPTPIDRVIRSYLSTLGPRGYHRANYLAEVLRIKRNILSHRRLEKELKAIDLYRHLIGLNHRLPRHTTWSQFRKTLGIESFLKIHAGYVLQAYRYGLLNPQIPALPKRRRTRYQCDRVCLQFPGLVAERGAERCMHLKRKNKHGKVFYTHFKKGYRKYGPLPPGTLMYTKLIKLRTAIERSFALKKENRYQMNHHLKVAGQEAVNIHVTLYDTVVVLDALFSAKMTH